MNKFNGLKIVVDFDKIKYDFLPGEIIIIRDYINFGTKLLRILALYSRHFLFHFFYNSFIIIFCVLINIQLIHHHSIKTTLTVEHSERNRLALAINQLLLTNILSYVLWYINILCNFMLYYYISFYDSSSLSN